MGKLDQLISEQVLTWSKREELAKKSEKDSKIWPVITISREFGARGKILASELNKRTGFKIWDKELLSAIADEAGADEKLLASLDEKRRSLIEDTLHGSLMGSQHSNTHYLRTLIRVVQTIGAHGKSIIVGRGSNYILKPASALRVRIVCPKKQRIAYIAKRDGMTKKDAEKLVNDRESERHDFIKHYFKRDPGNPSDFDLILNCDHFSNEDMADLVMSAYEKKMGKALPLVS